MLYSWSDNEDVQSVLEEFSSDESDTDENVFDEALELRESEEYAGERAYFCLFEDERGIFRRLFPSMYTEESFEEPDLTAVLLQEEAEAEEEKEKEDEANEDEKGKEKETEKEEGALLTEEDHKVNSSLVPSPATRFIDEHPGRALLIAIDPQLNRQKLREQHIEQYPGIDFYVAYIDEEPTGWALLFSTDEKHVEAMKALYTNHRFATNEDRLMFSRTQHKSGKGRKKGSVCASKKQKVNRILLSRMRDKDELSRVLEKMGGAERAIFVALDVEAAVVLPGAIPLPLELALVPLGTEHELLPVHCFIHPGKVKDMFTAIRLSCGVLPGSHYIPFKNANFLRRDYTQLAEEIVPFLTCERVIFVNKGSTMDVHALLWVFAAARAVENCDLPIPGFEDIFCFDIKTVVDVLSRGSTYEGVGFDDVEMMCWYHSTLGREIIHDLVFSEHIHCALDDAKRIINEIQLLL